VPVTRFDQCCRNGYLPGMKGSRLSRDSLSEDHPDYVPICRGVVGRVMNKSPAKKCLSACFSCFDGLKHVRLFLRVLALAAVVVVGGAVSRAAEVAGDAPVPSKRRVLHSPRQSGTVGGWVPETSKFSCGGRIVAPGDSRADVLEKCGEPAWKEVREDTVTEALLANRTPVNFVTTEEWVYNFGSSALLLFLRFQGDRLAVIETGGYGYDDPTYGQNCADGKNISLGDSKFDVLVKCGTPLEVGQFESSDAGQEGSSLLDGNEWTYNFGPDRLTYTFIFRKGRVSDIRTGGYGH
jgi:hypothetical protein